MRIAASPEPRAAPATLSTTSFTASAPSMHAYRSRTNLHGCGTAVTRAPWRAADMHGDDFGKPIVDCFPHEVESRGTTRDVSRLLRR